MRAPFHLWSQSHLKGMARFTLEQVETLRAAIASGVLSVRHGDTMTQYQSLSEMRKVLAEMETDLGLSTRIKRTRARFNRDVKDG